MAFRNLLQTLLQIAHHEIADTATVKIAPMSETSSSFPPPPPMPAPSGNILGRGIPGIQQSLFIMMVISLVGAVLYLLATINQFIFFTDLKELKFSSEVEIMNKATQSDSFISGSLGLYGIAFIAFTILFMIWCNKTTKNLVESGYRPEKSSGWVVGSFFVPIGNFFFVFGTIEDLLTGLGKFFTSIKDETPRLMKNWWIITVIGGLLMRGSDSTLTNDSDVDAYIVASGFEILSAFVLVIGLVFGVIAFKQLRDKTKNV